MGKLERVCRERRWTVAEARLVVEEWQRSAFTLEGFCRQHGLHVLRVQRWAERLRVAPATGPGQPAFLPVRVAAVTSPAAHATAERPAELVLPNGWVVRVWSDTQARSVRRAVEALQEGLPC